MNRVQMAALLGVSEDTVTDYARQGMPVETRGGAGKRGEYDAVACLDWWREHRGRNAKEAAQTRLFQANADTAELKLKVARGELVAVEDVARSGQAHVKAWSAKLLLLPTRLRHLGVITREQEAAIRQACRDILTDISTWKTVADALEAAKREQDFEQQHGGDEREKKDDEPSDE